MKVLVPIKRVIDYNVVVQIDPSSNDVVTDNVKMSMNPFDEIALEEAIRLCEKSYVDEIIVLSIGGEAVQEQLRQGLAMGAHRAIWVSSDDHICNDPLSVAKIIAAVIDQETCDLVLMGKQAIDNDCNQTGQMLAGLKNWPQATFVSEISIDQNTIIVSREVDGGIDDVSVSLPAVVTVDLRLNQPRYISLPNIMMAKRKPLDCITLETLGLALQPQLKRISLEKPQPRQSGTVYSDIDEFLNQLDEAQLWD